MRAGNIRYELNELTFPASFFEDEVREGFYVPTMMKRYWAGQLKVLSEIDRVCQKYSIRWFAIYGTLMGAVRHEGYIPWDDDLDICMLRDDYERFFEVAREEFPERYSVLDVRIEPEYELMIGRIVNNKNMIDCNEDHMKEFMGCPYTIGVDVFPLDNIYTDAEKEEDRIRRIKDISEAISMIKNDRLRSDAGIELLKLIEKDNNVSFQTGRGLKRELLLLANKIYSECPSEDSEDVVLMTLWVHEHTNRFPKDVFSDVIMLPFENTYVPAPGIYNEFLKLAYGEYMMINKSGGVHDYPVYGEQERILGDNIGQNPYRYTFSKEEFDKTIKVRNDHKTTDELCLGMTKVLHEAAIHVIELTKSGHSEGVMQLLEGSQNIAISLGTMLEERVSESEGAVHLLEDYCEILYECHETGAGYDATIAVSERIDAEVKILLSGRKKRILFLPCTARWWDTMKSYYEQLKSDNLNEILVLPVPYYEISVDGSVERIDEFGEFEDEVNIKPVTEYDFAHGYADEIVIQIPYDETNMVIRVPTFFYSKNLLEYTDELTYIPYLDPCEPEQDNNKATKSLAILTEQPAVVYSDRILLKSEGMKQFYINRLTELSGNDTRSYWDNKIEVLNAPENITMPSEGMKTIMYYVDASYLLQYGHDAIDKMKRNMACFEESADRIKCMLVVENRLEDICQESRKNAELMKEYSEILGIAKEKGSYTLVSYDEANNYTDSVSAYYGSAGVLAHKCRLVGKPVMIMGDVTI